MANQRGTNYFCPLYRREIADGKCFDINYERLGYASLGCLKEIFTLTGKKEPQITKTCETCPNLPFGDDLGTVTFPNNPAN